MTRLRLGRAAACVLLAGLLAPSLLQAQQSTDALHYKLEIELLFATSSIQGTQTATLKSLVSGLRTLELDLHSGLTVTKVTDDQSNPLSFSRPTDKIVIQLARAYAANEQFTVVVDYGGTPPASSSWGGMVFTTHQGSPICWTLSQPWDAKLWWPGKDQLGDKSTFEMWVTHPDTMSAASNGKLMGVDTLSGNRQRTRWSETYPIVPYLVSLAVTNYRRRTDTYSHMGASMPVEFYVFPESWNSWQSGMNALVPMLKAFSNVFGQYPFVKEKYGLAQFTWGGGMEHQTITSQYNADEWLSAHELGHQWWGDAITCATWHDIWLNEGFATFCEALWEELKPGGSMSAYHSYMNGRKPYRVDGTVYVYNPTNVNTIFSSTNVYRKGGWVVHMLRRTLGETLFWQALRDYRTKYEGDSATTADFQASVEKTVGRDMKWFFEQWVMQNGAPTYNYAWSQWQHGNQDYLLLELDQSQSYRPYYEMPVDVRITTTAGTENHVIWNDARQDAFVLPLQAPASSITIDPDEWILRPGTRTMAFRRPFFAASTKELQATAGGSVELHMDLGSAAAQRPYLLLATLSGSSPGIPLPGLTLPLNYDDMTQLGLTALNGPSFQNFAGLLDPQGRGAGRFVLPPQVGSAFRGRTLHFCGVLIDRLDTATTATAVTLR